MAATSVRVGGIPWYPVLLPLWPVGALYVANAAEVPWPELVRPALLLLAAAAGSYLLGKRLLRDRHKAGLACGALWLWFFGWGHVEHLLGRWPALLQQYLLSACLLWALLLAAVLGAVALTRRPLAPLGRSLNALAVAMVAWQAISVGWCAWRGDTAAREAPLPPAAVPPAVTRAGSLPSIYHIVLDTYGRQDVLRYLYGYDNEPFLRFLESRGFYVARQACSNYGHTRHSCTSTLACQYLRDSRRSDRRGSEYAGEPVLVERCLYQRGYRLQLRTYNTTAADDALPGGLPPSVLSNFEQKLLAMTLLPAAQPRPALDPRAAVTLALLRHLGDDVGREQPLFLRVHVLCPHPPFVLPPVIGRKARYVLNQEGEDGDRMGASVRDYVSGYRAQLAYLNEQLMPAVDRLLARAGPNSIVILQGDHGPGSQLRWDHPERTLIKERFGILLAVRLPPGPRPALRQDMTPVNLYPLLFGHYLGHSVPPRPEECYFSRFACDHEFLRVTAAARAKGWRLGYPGHWGPEVPPAAPVEASAPLAAAAASPAPLSLPRPPARPSRP